MSTLRIFLALCFSVLLAAATFAQEPVPADKVPYNIHETYYARFQRTTEAKWTKNRMGNYHVSFKKGDRSLMAEFSEDGRWQSTMETISVGQIPRDIVASVAKQMPGHKMKKGLKQETYSRGVIYTVTTEKAGKTYDFTFNPKGKLLYYAELTPPVK